MVMFSPGRPSAVTRIQFWRMEEEGRRLLQDAGIVPAKTATEAAESIVQLTAVGKA